MGNGSAVQRRQVECHGKVNLFYDRELYDASAFFSRHVGARKAFASYLKNGTWIPKLAAYKHGYTKKYEDNHCPSFQPCNYLQEYEVVPDDINILKEIFNKENNFKSGSLKKGFGEYSQTESSKASYLFDYLDAATTTCFSADQLMAFMVSIVLRIYLGSKEYHQWGESMRRRDNCVEVDSSCGCCTDSFDEDGLADVRESAAHMSLRGMVKTQRSERLQELLHGVAAYFDETDLLQVIKEQSWIGRIQEAIDTCPLGISVIDLSQDGFPMAYSNKALSALTGYRCHMLRGMSLKDLQGRNTSVEMAARLHSALTHGKAIKLAIHNYTRKGHEYLSMVAVCPVAQPQTQSYSDLQTHAQAHAQSCASDLHSLHGPGDDSLGFEHEQISSVTAFYPPSPDHSPRPKAPSISPTAASVGTPATAATSSHYAIAVHVRPANRTDLETLAKVDDILALLSLTVNSTSSLPDSPHFIGTHALAAPQPQYQPRFHPKQQQAQSQATLRARLGLCSDSDNSCADENSCRHSFSSTRTSMTSNTATWSDGTTSVSFNCRQEVV